MPTIPLQELRRAVRVDKKVAAAELIENLNAKKLKPDDFSIRDLFEAFVGREALDRINYRRSGRMSLQEASGAVDSAMFSNITGQIVYGKVMEMYELNSLIADQLCSPMTAITLQQERVPGIGGPSNLFDIVPEGEPYPVFGINEQYVDLPPLQKRGGTIELTREAIIEDKTGQLLEAAGKLGEMLALNKEKRVLDVVTGQVNTYKRNGTSTNTYLTSGAYVNSHSNVMVDFSDIENSFLLAEALTDPNTGEFMKWDGETTIIVPTALKLTAQRILNAISVEYVDNQASNTATFRTMSSNPLGAYSSIKLVTSVYVKNATSSASTWFHGMPKKAFVYREAWGIETMEASDNNESKFTRDIWNRFRVSENGRPGVLEPRWMIKNT